MQYTTFKIADFWYGIDVMKIQEITHSFPLTSVPLVDPFIIGLINLRGQVAITISLSVLFGLDKAEASNKKNIFCNIDNSLIAVEVDKIGDVIEVNPAQKKVVPSTIPESTRGLLKELYETPEGIISIVNVEEVNNKINS